MKKNILYFFSALMLTALFSVSAYAGCAPGETYLVVQVNADDYFAGDMTVVTVTVNGVVEYMGTPPDGLTTTVVDGCFPEGAMLSVDYTDAFGDGILVNPPIFVAYDCAQAVSEGDGIMLATAASGTIYTLTLPADFDDLASGTTGSGSAIGTTAPATNGAGCTSGPTNTTNFGTIAVSPTIPDDTTPPAFPSGVTGYPICDTAGGDDNGNGTLTGASTSDLTEDIEVCATFVQPNVTGNETGAYIGLGGPGNQELLDSNGDGGGDGNGVNDCGGGFTQFSVLDANCNLVAANTSPVTGLTPGDTYTVCVTAFVADTDAGADGVFGTADDPAPADGICNITAIGIGVQPFEPPLAACDIGADVGNDVVYCFGDAPADLTTDAGSDFTGFDAGPNAGASPGVAYVEICGAYDPALDATPGDPTSNPNYTGFLVGTAYTYAPGAADGGDGEGTGCDYITLVPVTYIDIDAATGQFILDADAANICTGTPIRLDFRPEITTTPGTYSCATGITVVVDGGSPDDGTIAVNNDGTATVPGDYVITGDVSGTTSGDQIVFTDLADGTYNYTVTDPAGCTTTGSFTVAIVPLDATEMASLCPGDSYTASTGTVYTASGSEMFIDANGCMAVLTVDITPLVPIDATEAASLCPGDSYTASTGTVYTASGTETFTDANGCTATLTVTITPLVPADISEMATLCAPNGDTYTASTGTVYTASGTETFTDANGCTATLTVTIMNETPACGDATATNYDPNATCIDNTLCTFGAYCDNICFAEFAANPGPNDTPDATLCVTPLGCADLATIDPSCISTQACDDGDPCTANEEATVILADGSVCMDCGLNSTPVTPACGDPTATNYDPNATCIDNTLCTFGAYCDNICFAEYVANPGANDTPDATLCVTPLGCADLATIDPSCISTQACDDGDPCTANEEATVILADGSVCTDCGLNSTPVTPGCGDPTATNYDPNATCIDNTTCVFPCEDDIAGTITLDGCDFTGAEVTIYDATGAVVGVAATDAMGNYSLTGPFPCGSYSAEVTAAPACYVDAGGDPGPRTFVVDGDGTPDGFDFGVISVSIPTVGEWGLIILGLLMSITAIVGIRQRREEENQVWG